MSGLSELPNGVAVLGWSQEYTASHNFKTTSLTDAPSIVWDLASNQVASVTLAGNRTLANPTGMRNGGVYILFVKQDNQGGRTLIYGSNFAWTAGNTAPTLTATPNRLDILTFISDGSKMYGSGTFNYIP